MAQQSRKRRSDEIEAGRDIPTTPTGSPARKRMKISQPQKQALIDNLQLEITERARHLRAQYALQATDLRSRIERRINRIPISLRKANLGELLTKYAEATIAKETPRSLDSPEADVHVAETRGALPSVPREIPVSPPKPSSSIQLSPRKSAKRRSSEIAILSDKEDEPTAQLKNPKRAKTATSTPPRTASQAAKANRGNVLSPKSHNSRTLPRSPIKDTNLAPYSPSKPFYLARPTSPLKPASPLKTAASAATSAISASLHGMVEHAKRGAGNAAAGLRRTASKDKALAAAAAAAEASAKGKMAPPPRRAAAAAQQTDRPASQVSNHSAASNSSAMSSATTVVTKKQGKKGKTTLSGTTTAKATGTMSTKASTGKGASGKATAAAAKKVIVAEPAAGRRVLRRRN